MVETKECPRCNRKIEDDSLYWAYSRTDNTKICSECGTEEALIDWANR